MKEGLEAMQVAAAADRAYAKALSISLTAEEGRSGEGRRPGRQEREARQERGSGFGGQGKVEQGASYFRRQVLQCLPAEGPPGFHD